MGKLTKAVKGCTMELLIFAILWLLIFLLPVLQELLNISGDNVFSWRHVLNVWRAALPFLIAFLLHAVFILPLYSKRRKGILYTVLTAILILSFAVGMHHVRRIQHGPRPHPKEMHKPGKGHFPSPVLMDSLILLFLFGFETAVAVLFEFRRKEAEHKQLENMRVQDELKYLKAQIDPHFFMNMLNNIHTMVDVNPEMAQRMILELSKLMRYVLYEGCNYSTSFSNEVQFIANYVDLMRQRYPADKVEIKLEVPESPSSSLFLPPLLFISFVENAFKHGVSYVRQSSISISISEDSGKVCFTCTNTVPPSENFSASNGGVGLSNARRRLDILYHDSYKLDIRQSEDLYSVNLIIPGL